MLGFSYLLLVFFSSILYIRKMLWFRSFFSISDLIGAIELSYDFLYFSQNLRKWFKIEIENKEYYESSLLNCCNFLEILVFFPNYYFIFIRIYDFEYYFRNTTSLATCSSSSSSFTLILISIFFFYKNTTQKLKIKKINTFLIWNFDFPDFLFQNINI